MNLIIRYDAGRVRKVEVSRDNEEKHSLKDLVKRGRQTQVIFPGT